MSPRDKISIEDMKNSKEEDEIKRTGGNEQKCFGMPSVVTIVTEGVRYKCAQVCPLKPHSNASVVPQPDAGKQARCAAVPAGRVRSDNVNQGAGKERGMLDRLD